MFSAELNFPLPGRKIFRNCLEQYNNEPWQGGFMPYKVLRSENFEKILKRYPRELLSWIEKLEIHLAFDPYTGNPVRVPWLREKKYGKFKLYFLIFVDHHIVYLVNLSDKKNQQQVIDTIFYFLEVFNEEIREKLKN